MTIFGSTSHCIRFLDKNYSLLFIYFVIPLLEPFWFSIGSSKHTIMKELVKLRKKKMKDGGESLYLCYSVNGVRKYEYLSLYLSPGNDAITRKRNSATLDSARVIQAQRVIDLQNGKAGIRKSGKTALSEYGEKYLDRHISQGTKIAITTATNQWLNIIGDKSIESVCKDDVLKFIETISETRKPSTVYLKVSILSSIFQCAVKDELIAVNPFSLLKNTERPKNEKGERQYLTMEEIHKVMKTPCKFPDLKAAFLFSCFTGLRFSDIYTLDWSMIVNGEIVKTQYKTHEVVRIPISDNAAKFLPKRGKGLVFNLPERYYYPFDQWIKTTGIKKHITFHCARHTFACLLLSYGTDIYTTSKLLGHTSVKTTEIYAHIVDEKKRAAVDNIPKL